MLTSMSSAWTAAAAWLLVSAPAGAIGAPLPAPAKAEDPEPEDSSRIGRGL